MTLLVCWKNFSSFKESYLKKGLLTNICEKISSKGRTTGNRRTKAELARIEVSRQFYEDLNSKKK